MSQQPRQEMNDSQKEIRKIADDLLRNIFSFIRKTIMEKTETSEVGLDAYPHKGETLLKKLTQSCVKQFETELLKLEAKLNEDCAQQLGSTDTLTEADVQLEISELEEELQRKTKLIENILRKAQGEWLTKLSQTASTSDADQFGSWI